MDQTHIGYTGWRQPPSNAMPQVVKLQLPGVAEMGVSVEGSTNARPQSSGEAVLPAFDKFNEPSHYIDIFNQGKIPFQFSATASVPWILLGRTNETVEKDQRLWVGVDWRTAPTGLTNGIVKISDGGTNSFAVKVDLFNPQEPAEKSLKGFVEADGYVSIEAEHFTKKTGTASARWEKIDDLGRTLSAMSIFPVTASSVTPPQNSPCLEYKMYLFHPGKVEVESILSPSLNFVSGRGLRFAVSFDDQPPQIAVAVPENFSVGAGDGNRDWEQTVKDNVRKVKTAFTLEKFGEHTLKFWMVDPGVVLQKIVVDLGGVKPSYLGPPESFHH
jgi:Gylcosyl hydrolase family 115 C-terminal domain